MQRIVRSMILAALAVLAAGCATASSQASCDRACLRGKLDLYLAALQSGDLASADLARRFRATRNGVQIAAADMRFRALGDVQRFYADPVTGQAAYLGVIESADGPALTAIRIRVEGGKISESEQFYARQGDTLFSLDGFRALPPRTTAPAGARPTREQMVAAANSYFEGLSTHSGANIIHAPGCVRLENGTRVTQRAPRPGASEVEAREMQNRDCAGGMEGMTQIRTVALRRYPLVDEEAGVVMGIGLFLRPPGQTGNFARRNLLTEFFELQDGRISAIYAVMHYLEADAPESTGWD